MTIKYTWTCTLRAVALLAVLGITPLTASADPIMGAITMSGDFAPTGGSGLGDATGVDFLGDDFVVDGATGDFHSAGISQGDIGFIQDFSFNPFDPNSVDPLWAIGGFTFALDTINIIFQNDWYLILEGSGFLSGSGFDDTKGTWNLTANAAGSLFNFSSGSASVPEPGSLVLLGLGLIGMGFARRRRSVELVYISK